jgi:hypothetical protein
MPLNHCSDYKCAHTYIQTPYNWNYKLSDVSTSRSLHDNLAPTTVQLHNHNLCLDLSAMVVTNFMRRQWYLASLVSNYLWVWGCLIHDHVGGRSSINLWS